MTAKPRSGSFKALRFAGLVAFAGLGIAVFFVGGSYLYWQSGKANDVVSQRNLQELRNRRELLMRELADLQGSVETYKSLIERGAFAPERRLDFIEAMAELKKRHKLLGLEYDIAPQRPLKFATGASYAAVGIMASRVQFKVQAYHDGDLVAFLDEFPRIQRGFFPIDKCAIKRIAGAEQRQQTVPGTNARPGADHKLVAEIATIEATCTMEWITMAVQNPATMPVPAILRKVL
jgi:hypothetical protein